MARTEMKPGRGSNPKSHRNKPIVRGIRRIVDLTEKQWEIVKAIGQGKYSQGVRKLVEFYSEQENMQIESIDRPWVLGQTLKNANIPTGWWGEVTKAYDGSLEVTTFRADGSPLKGQESIATQEGLRTAGWQLIEWETH
jgi:hypothetical protein